jgi:hypothetical protein
MTVRAGQNRGWISPKIAAAAVGTAFAQWGVLVLVLTGGASANFRGTFFGVGDEVVRMRAVARRTMLENTLDWVATRGRLRCLTASSNTSTHAFTATVVAAAAGKGSGIPAKRARMCSTCLDHLPKILNIVNWTRGLSATTTRNYIVACEHVGASGSPESSGSPREVRRWRLPHRNF